MGTDPNSTYVTGQTTASARVVTTSPLPAADPTITYVTGQPPNPMQQITAGTVRFNRLISLDGVNHIELNGFNLSRTVAPVPGTVNNLGPEIYLPGGVRYLSFNNIEAPIDRAFADQPIEIVIGRPDAPLPYQPTIRIASIFNTVYDSRLRINPNGTPPTDPTVSIIVNGQLQGLEMVSATNAPVMGGQQYVYPTVGTTGRTAVQALGIGTVKALGTVRNTTLSRSPQPFSSGLNRLDRLSVGGIADGLRVDVSRGDIGQIKLRRGLGDPTGALSDNRTAPSGARTGTIYLGQPFPQFGNPSFGIDGGLIVARRIGKVTAGPAYDFLQTGQDPDYQQIRSTRSTTYYPRAGQALTNDAVLTGFGIRRVDVVGDAQNSEIKAGFHFPSFVSGLEPVRVPSSIGRVRWRGNLISSVASATYRTGPDLSYGQADDVASPGRIAGSLQQGALYSNNQATVLANGGVGFYARRKDGYLPSPQRPR